MRIRPRRNRKTAAIRALANETHLPVEKLIYPLFIVEGKGIKEEINALPGQYRFSTDEVLKEIGNCVELGLQAFVLFPAVKEKHKDASATYSYSEDNFYLKAIKAIKKKLP